MKPVHEEVNRPEIITGIPFFLDKEALIREAHLDPVSDDAQELRNLADTAAQAGKPKAVYTVSFVEHRDRDTVQIGGLSFTSRLLSRNLQSAERVFPLIATCGNEIDRALPVEGDVLKEFWRDLIKSALLAAANKYLHAHLHRRFRLGRTALMRPGSGDAQVWPIEQQKELFALLGDVEKNIGVQLSRSFLMTPNKTNSGILFPVEKDFRSCEVCHRENCPGRGAPFNPQLWEEIQTGRPAGADSG